MEQEIMKLIMDGGDARSKAVEAMRSLKENKFEEARQLIKECNECILRAHKVQTKLIQNEANGYEMNVQLLMVHAQDHLMDAMVMRDVVENLIGIQENNYKLINKMNV